MDIRSSFTGLTNAVAPSPDQPTIRERGDEVARILYDTRDESGVSDKAFAVFKKDWDRFVRGCDGNTPPPLHPQESILDFKDYINYMRKYGDKVRIGTTRCNMKEIVEDCYRRADESAKAEYKKSVGQDPKSRTDYESQFLVSLAQNLAKDNRITNDYCFLRFPAEELANSALPVAQSAMRQILSTRDSSGVPGVALMTIAKDWNRFNARAFGEPQQPLPLKEATEDFMVSVCYDKDYGNRIRIGNTTLANIVESDRLKAKEMSQNKQDTMEIMTLLAHLIAQDERISDNDCIWRLPSIEFLDSLEAQSEFTHA